MPRVKGGKTTLKRRRNILARVKGFRFGRSTKKREAKTAFLHAGTHAFAHRRDKKNDFRRLWNIKIGAAVRALGLSYSQLIGLLKKKNVELDRKILADLAENNPDTFKQVVEYVK
ncbi:MAG: 50S ribosomal protein L20 [Candidatus Vogelbacteria bacterium RIFOXYD1_FULL_46_19]|uniref:Large ribosomal subunit protein bL20 n=1 Tax=Candidatus Vogelbacteria bacterium RIFOXYD1_FULL_46_19 TaxID=1802439 RepID=A0A1G2QH41_9BACT|nr:MAG: 50S ribosomal protein L20 [Candidatus Vogelbacteria bacterium RIFOXYD1_FULL_46_19]